MNEGAPTWLDKQVRKYQHKPEYELGALLLDLNVDVIGGMERLGLSRTDLAERLGTSRAYVTKLLDGQENMTLKTLVRVANALEMKVDARFIPRERAARPAKKARVKTDLKRPAEAKTAAKTRAKAVAKTRPRASKRAVAARSRR